MDLNQFVSLFLLPCFVSQPCNHQTSRNRTRQILRLPASPQDPPCPDLVQSEPCVLNSTCFTHQYRVSGRIICTAGCHSPPGLFQWLQLTLFATCDFRLEHMPAEWKRHVWGRFPPASPRLHSQRWENCGFTEVWAGKKRKDRNDTLPVSKGLTSSLRKHWAPVVWLTPWVWISSFSVWHAQSFRLLPWQIEMRSK